MLSELLKYELLLFVFYMYYGGIDILFIYNTGTNDISYC